MRIAKKARITLYQCLLLFTKEVLNEYHRFCGVLVFLSYICYPAVSEKDIAKKKNREFILLILLVICALIEEYLNYRLIVKRMEKENKNDGQGAV